MRKLQIYVDAYGPVAGPKLYHALQSQAAHAGVSARLRKKIRALTDGSAPAPRRSRSGSESEVLPLFPEAVAEHA